MPKSLNILLIEDDLIEIMKFNRIVKKLNFGHKINEVNNGEEAIDFLKIATKIPDIIILDLNMPKMSGLEFLEILKNNPLLKHIPLIVLTTSNNINDVTESYRLGIAGYFIKPLKYEDSVESIIILLDYWSSNQFIST